MNKFYGILALLFFCGKAYSTVGIPYSCDDAQTGLNTQEIKVYAPMIMHAPDPVGTIIWRSQEENRSYRCWHGKEKFNANYYLNPQNNKFGEYVDLGVTINGKDYLYSEWQNKPIPGEIIDDDHGGTITSSKINYRISFFFIKKKPVTTSIFYDPYVIYDFTIYNIGASSASSTSKLSVLTDGYMQVRIPPCVSNVKIVPNTIDFGKLYVSDAIPQREIKRVAFTITEERACAISATYAISGYLRPSADSNLIENMQTLVPRNNSSVGINIIDLSNNKPIPFNKEFDIAKFSSGSFVTVTHSKPLEARLKWLGLPAKAGVFNAGAILDIYYK